MSASADGSGRYGSEGLAARSTRLLVEERPYLDFPLAGLPEQREELVALYRRLLEPIGYRVARLVKADDVWTTHFEKEGDAGREEGGL